MRKKTLGGSRVRSQGKSISRESGQYCQMPIRFSNMNVFQILARTMWRRIGGDRSQTIVGERISGRACALFFQGTW